MGPVASRRDARDVLTRETATLADVFGSTGAVVGIGVVAWVFGSTALVASGFVAATFAAGVFVADIFAAGGTVTDVGSSGVTVVLAFTTG